MTDKSPKLGSRAFRKLKQKRNAEEDKKRYDAYMERALENGAISEEEYLEEKNKNNENGTGGHFTIPKDTKPALTYESEFDKKLKAKTITAVFQNIVKESAPIYNEHGDSYSKCQFQIEADNKTHNINSYVKSDIAKQLLNKNEEREYATDHFKFHNGKKTTQAAVLRPINL